MPRSYIGLVSSGAGGIGGIKTGEKVKVGSTTHFYFAQMLHRKKAQMLRRKICVTSVKFNLCNICAK